MKKVLYIFIIMLMTAGAIQSETVNEIVARVNDQIITDFDIQLVLIFNRGEDLSYQQVLDKMIEDQLVIASAKNREYEINDQEIDYNVDQSIANQRAQYPTDELFKEALRHDGLTLASLKENYRKQIKNQYLKDMIITDKIRKKISISTEEVEAYYNENRDKFKKSAARYKLSTIYFSAVDLKAMQNIYRNIKRGGKVPVSVEVKEFKKLYLEYLTDDQRKLLSGVGSGYTDFALSEKGLSFYKIIKFDEKTPSVKYFVIPNMKTDASLSEAKAKAVSAKESLDKGADFFEMKSKEDPDQDNYFPTDAISVPSMKDLGILEKLEDLDIGGTAVIVADLGVYIVTVDDMLSEEFHDIGNVYTRIYNEKYQEKFEKLLTKLVEEAKSDNFIKVYK